MVAMKGSEIKNYAIFFSLSLLLIGATFGQKEEDKKDSPDEKWKKKDVRDYSDADLERLYEQWEEDDDPLEDDELPEWKRPRPQVDLNDIDPNDPEDLLKRTKRGQTLMMFVTVSGSPEEKETEQITQLWQSSLFNANYELQRYIVGSDRALFMLKDGAKSWEVKDFLVSQERCHVVTIEGKDYHGRAHPEYTSGEDKAKEEKKSDKKKSEDKKSDKKKKTSDKKKSDKKKKTDKKDTAVKKKGTDKKKEKPMEQLNVNLQTDDLKLKAKSIVDQIQKKIRENDEL